MLFNSLSFLIFFPLVVCVCFLLPKKARYIWLLIASYYFYMCWNAKYALLLLASTVITYLSGLYMDSFKDKKKGNPAVIKRKKICVAVSFALDLSILFFFKYFDFAVDSLSKVLALVHIQLNQPSFDVLLPVGISFYTFQALSYTMDVYRGEIYAERNFLRYALFVSFFPQLVAGPIERSKNLLRQLSEDSHFDYDNVRTGLLWMLWGFFLKVVISDRCAVLVNTVYGNCAAYQGFQLIAANVCFALQIYCDFMGYSTIAKGAAKVLGYDIMDNFRQPYFAATVKDFWRRWHISLSTWFRDYLYFPLGGSRRGTGRTYFNIMVVFLVSGLWHGASWTFVVWGGVHGLLQVIEGILTPPFEKLCDRMHVRRDVFSWRALGTVKTFILVDAAWVFFRAGTIPAAFQILKNSLKLSNVGLILNDGLLKLGLNSRNMSILVFALMLLLSVSVIQEKGTDIVVWITRQNAVFRYAAYWTVLILILFSLDITGQEFLYFQF